MGPKTKIELKEIELSFFLHSFCLKKIRAFYNKNVKMTELCPFNSYAVK